MLMRIVGLHAMYVWLVVQSESESSIIFLDTVTFSLYDANVDCDSTT